MKNLRNTTLLFALSLMLVFVGCKKNGALPGDDNENPDQLKGISAAELVDYYLVTERKTSNAKLGIMYFTKEGDVVTASLHGSGYLRSKEIVASNSSFSFNSDGFGTYNYTLEKDASGVIKLKSYDLNGGTDLAFAQLIKKTDASVFASSSFKAGDLIFKLSAPAMLEWDFKNRIIGYNPGTPPFFIKTPIFENKAELSLPYYSLMDLGFKTNNDQFIGVVVPSWNDNNTALLLIEKAGGPVLKAIKQ